MEPEIQLNFLKTLIAINEEGSFNAAAIRVGRTQSAVTQQMQHLEHIIGVPLFITKGRQRELTEAGLTLLRYGREIISLCNYAVSATNQSQQSGVIKIGAPHEVAENILPHVLLRYSKVWKDMNVVIHVGRSPELMKKLEEGRLDLTISSRRSGNYKSTLLTKKPVLWIAAPNWEWNTVNPLPLILSDEPSLFRRMCLSALDLSSQSYIEKFTSPSLAGVRSAVATGLGVTARPKSAFLTNVQVLDENNGLPPLPDVSYYLHQSTQQVSNQYNDLFDIILEAGENLNS